MLTDFHFLAPWWLVALLPLAWLWWQLKHDPEGAAAWRTLIAPHLLAVLLRAGGASNRRNRQLALGLLATGWIITVLGLANPTFEQQPVPTFASAMARVLVLDLSQSMLTADLTPNRLARARYKVADLLERSRDGQVGLVVFAGDAFVVSPLTTDVNTIHAMLDVLTPDLMPRQGSRVDRGLDKARDLLDQAGAERGLVILLADDIADVPRAQAAATTLREAGHRLSVIGVGTPAGGQVPGVRTSSGAVLSSVDTPGLRTLAAAGGGNYAQIATTDADLDQVLRAAPPDIRHTQVSDALADRWYELGPWIALLLLPIAALAFRRGWVWSLILLMPLGLVPPPTLAAGSTLDSTLWQRADQREAELQQRGIEQYRAGDYAAAAASFGKGQRAIDHYNRGNALAYSGDLQQALAAYDQALALDPKLEEARYNRDRVEQLLREQQPPPPDDSENQQPPDDSTNQQPPESEQDQSEQNEDNQQSSANEFDQQQEAQPQQPPAETADDELESPLAQSDDWEQEQAADQWLRRIPDDPGGLLRRKFLLQYRQRGTDAQDTADNPW